MGGNCSARPPAEEVLAEVEAFISQVETETGTEIVLYVLDDFNDLYPALDRFDRPRWERRIFLRPGGDWLIWQYTFEGDVDGVESGVDINVMREHSL
jgi:lysozyme